jgi:threonine dehydratase
MQCHGFVKKGYIDAHHKLLTLNAEGRRRGVIAMNTGNHARRVALYSAGPVIKATIVMPENTPVFKMDRTRTLGAEVLIKGVNFAETSAHVQKSARGKNLTLIHPYNDPVVIDGRLDRPCTT